MRPVEVPAGLFRPLPGELAGIACAFCNRLAGRWEMAAEENADPVFLCSPCVLYETSWGRQAETQARFVELIFMIETETNRLLERDARERLVGRDADRVVYAVVMTAGLTRLGRR